MVKKILIATLCLLIPLFALADKLILTKHAPKTYIVKKGDTLWDISALFLKRPWLWPKLWRYNPDITNPHLIYPGDKLNLVFDKQGQPMLVKSKPVLKWSPSIRKTLKDLTPISTISLSVIAPFLKYENVLTQQQIDSSPYVLGSDEGYKSSIEDFKLYINSDLVLGHKYAIYSKGEAINDTKSGDLIGYYVKLAGTGTVTHTGDMAHKKPSTLLVDDIKQEIRSGFLVLPVNENQMYPSYYKMQAAPSTINGTIIRTSSNLREFGKYDVVMIDKGRQDAIALGDILAVKRKSPGVVETTDGPVYQEDTSRWNRMASADGSDYVMPEETLGRMMIFKVYDKVSMALILSSIKPLRLQDTVTAPK